MIAAAVAALALALPPQAVVVPGRSFAGLRLGATQTQVRRAWGIHVARCRDCAQPTLYFTYVDFQPQGAAATFVRGRATEFFTLWGPRGWRSNRGLKIGDPEVRVAAVYGVLPRTECGTYAALVLRQGGTDTQFYIYKREVWGFGLTRAGAPPCR